jgi:serine protease Do
MMSAFKIQSLSLLCIVSVFAQNRELATIPSLAPLVDSVKSAVVNVEVRKQTQRIESLDDLMARRRAGEEPPSTGGSGSGFIVDPSGIVITNNHVVSDAVGIRVMLEDGRHFEAEVLGRDPLTDIAVLKLKGQKGALPAVKLGDSGALKVGDWVVAIGNPFGLASSVSAGIISALERQIGASRYDQFLQTDAAINPGNSGGPLFNLNGEVVGMNTAIIGAATGIGFAVPSNLIKVQLPQLQKNGRVVRGWLGVAPQNISASLAKILGVPSRFGALLASVNEGSPAAKAGLRAEDVVTTIDGERVLDASSLTRIIALKSPESTIALGIIREKEPLEIKVKLGIRPDLEGLGDMKNPTEKPQFGKLGLGIDNVDPRLAQQMNLPKAGALVVEVTPMSAAEEAGFKRGMVVIELNRKPVTSGESFLQSLKSAKSGSTLLLKVAMPGGATSLLAIEI